MNILDFFQMPTPLSLCLALRGPMNFFRPGGNYYGLEFRVRMRPHTKNVAAALLRSRNYATGRKSEPCVGYSLQEP